MTSAADTSQHLGRRLAEEGEKTEAFFRSLGSSDWAVRVYTDGQAWTVADLLAHFVSAETEYLHYLKEALANREGAPYGLDVDEFNAANVPVWRRLPVEALIREFSQVRAEAARLARSLRAEDLERKARHPWFGPRPIAWLLQLCYNHNSMHLRDIRRALAGRSASRGHEETASPSPRASEEGPS